MYDYGKDINLEIYGRPTPLLYPLEKISVPTLLVSSFNDTLISLKVILNYEKWNFGVSMKCFRILNIYMRNYQ